MINKLVPPSIRIFISSTFIDMKEERDVLMQDIMPYIKEFCEDLGVSLFMVDLRWGIIEEERKQGKVISSCLDEIDKCRPFFIGFLGERYGWIPEELSNELIKEYPFLSKYKGKSLTELEMLYGVLDNEKNIDKNCASFFIRESNTEKINNIDNDTNIEKLNKLKENIINSKFNSYTYKNIEEFSNLLKTQLCNWLETYYHTNLDLTTQRQNWYLSECMRNSIINE